MLRPICSGLMLFYVATTLSVAQQPDEKIVYKRTTGADGAAVKLALHVFKPDGHAAGDRRPHDRRV